MIVVSNTSPIINLASVGQLDLLQQLYGKVTIPEAVYQEIVIVGAGQPGATEVQTLQWFEVKLATNQVLVGSLQLEIDEGEAEAIALAIELQTDLLLIDEKRGRAAASRLGVKHTGLIGILLEAKKAGFILAIKPILDDMINNGRFWVHKSFYDYALQLAGE